MPLDSAFTGLGEEKANILLVDDLPEKLLALESLLEVLGQNVTSVRPGDEALREVLTREFAVILLDVDMPGVNGFETAEAIRRCKRSAYTPIVFITSHADEMQAARGHSLGAVDYILAPVVPEALRSKVKVFVELHLMQRQVRRRADERIALAASEAARHIAEENTRRSTFLSHASRVLSGSLDVGIAMRKLLSLVVPTLARSATLVLVVDCQPPRRALIAVTEPCGDGRPAVQQNFDALPAAEQSAFMQALKSGLRTPVPIDGSRVGGEAGSVYPLLIGERTIGALLVQADDATDSEAMLNELTGRAAIALENARLYRSLQLEIDERSHAEKQLQDSNQRKDEFLAVLSHELRNPLAPIRNAVQVLRHRSADDPQVVWAADITERQVKQLTRLVDDLLDMARISQGKIVLQSEPIDLLSVIEHSIETIRPLIRERRHTLTQDLPDKPLWVRGDAARLSQVVSNLLNNAAKYTDMGGRIHVDAGLREGQVVVGVRDNGIGIEAEVLPNVFELFEQGRRSLDHSQGGLGIGLTLVRRLVQMHSGRVEVSSEGVGKGSEFRIFLPPIADQRQSSVPSRATPEPDRNSCRVLVVDDNRDAAESTAVCLEMAGHEVLWVDDALQALATAAEFAPHAVVLDIGLPSMDGFEVARRLRKLPQTSESLLVALTGYGHATDRLKGADAGFDEHLTKPAEPDALLKIVSQWCSASLKRQAQDND